MKKIIILITVSLFLFNCKTNKLNKIDTKPITINLKTKFENNPVMSSVQFVYFPDSIPSNYKGIHQKDKIKFAKIFLFEKSEIDKFLEDGIITKEQYDDIKLNIDCLIGIKEEGQFFILDQNFNKDFSDDKVITINYMFDDSNSEKYDSIPVFKSVVYKIDKFQAFKDSVAIKFYPKEIFSTKNNKVTFNNIKTSKLLFIDYFFGEFNVHNTDYKMAISKYNLFGPDLIIRKKDSTFYRYNDKMYLKYKPFDTLRIGMSYYRIDTIQFSPPIVKIRELPNVNMDFGFRIGYKIKNYELEDLYINRSFKFDYLLKEKKYILIDFWGTWCAPCKELTPELVRMNKDYSSSLNILSVAFQKDKNELIDYIKKNKMNWNHVFLQGNSKSANNRPSLIKNLRIEAYPTFLLIDKSRKIVYRGIGKKALNEIEEIIKN